MAGNNPEAELLRQLVVDLRAPELPEVPASAPTHLLESLNEEQRSAVQRYRFPYLAMHLSYASNQAQMLYPVVHGQMLGTGISPLLLV